MYPSEKPQGEPYKDYIAAIKSACENKTEKIAVLELGCGTGRFFHHLSNVKRLVGVDFAQPMIDVAKENIKGMPELEPVTEFVCSSLEDFNTTEKFDFVYSIGTIAEFVIFDRDFAEKMISFLKPDGHLYTTLVDSELYVDKEIIGPRWRLIRFLIRFLPQKLRLKVGAKFLKATDWKELWLTKSKVESILNSVRIPIRYELSRTKDRLHVHHVCKIQLKDAK